MACQDYFVPSEVARLILGYLRERNFHKSFNTFLRECPDLTEYWQLLRAGKNPATTILGYGLTEILNEFAKCKLNSLASVCCTQRYAASVLPTASTLPTAVHNNVQIVEADIQKCLEEEQREKSKKEKKRVSDQKRDWKRSSQNRRKIFQPERRADNPSLLPQQNSSTSTVPYNPTLLQENTPISRPVMNNERQQSSFSTSIQHCPGDESLGFSVGKVINEEAKKSNEFEFLDKLLEETQLHEKLAENINKALSNVEVDNTSSVSVASDITSHLNTNHKDLDINQVIAMTESDPAFQSFLKLFQHASAVPINHFDITDIECTDNNTRQAPEVSVFTIEQLPQVSNITTGHTPEISYITTGHAPEVSDIMTRQSTNFINQKVSKATSFPPVTSASPSIVQNQPVTVLTTKHGSSGLFNGKVEIELNTKLLSSLPDPSINRQAEETFNCPEISNDKDTKDVTLVNENSLIDASRELNSSTLSEVADTVHIEEENFPSISSSLKRTKETTTSNSAQPCATTTTNCPFSGSKSSDDQVFLDSKTLNATAESMFTSAVSSDNDNPSLHECVTGQIQNTSSDSGTCVSAGHIQTFEQGISYPDAVLVKPVGILIDKCLSERLSLFTSNDDMDNESNLKRTVNNSSHSHRPRKSKTKPVKKNQIQNINTYKKQENHKNGSTVNPTPLTEADLNPSALTEVDLNPTALPEAGLNPVTTTEKDIHPIATTDLNVKPMTSTEIDNNGIATIEVDINPIDTMHSDIKPLTTKVPELKPLEAMQHDKEVSCDQNKHAGTRDVLNGLLSDSSIAATHFVTLSSPPFYTMQTSDDYSPRKLAEGALKEPNSSSLPASLNYTEAPDNQSSAFTQVKCYSFAHRERASHARRTVISVHSEQVPFTPHHCRKLPSRRIRPTNLKSVHIPSSLGLSLTPNFHIRKTPTHLSTQSETFVHNESRKTLQETHSETSLHKEYTKLPENFSVFSETSLHQKCKKAPLDTHSDISFFNVNKQTCNQTLSTDQTLSEIALLKENRNNRKLTQSSTSSSKDCRQTSKLTQSARKSSDLNIADLEALGIKLPPSPSKRKPRRIQTIQLTSSFNHTSNKSNEASKVGQNSPSLDDAKTVTSSSDFTASQSEIEAFRMLSLLTSSYTKPQPRQEITSANHMLHHNHATFHQEGVNIYTVAQKCSNDGEKLEKDKTDIIFCSPIAEPYQETSTDTNASKSFAVVGLMEYPTLRSIEDKVNINFHSITENKPNSDKIEEFHPTNDLDNENINCQQENEANHHLAVTKGDDRGLSKCLSGAPRIAHDLDCINHSQSVHLKDTESQNYSQNWTSPKNNQHEDLTLFPTVPDERSLLYQAMTECQLPTAEISNITEPTIENHQTALSTSLKQDVLVSCRDKLSNENIQVGGKGENKLSTNRKSHTSDRKSRSSDKKLLSKLSPGSHKPAKILPKLSSTTETEKLLLLNQAFNFPAILPAQPSPALRLESSALTCASPIQVVESNNRSVITLPPEYSALFQSLLGEVGITNQGISNASQSPLVTGSLTKGQGSGKKSSRRKKIEKHIIAADNTSINPIDLTMSVKASSIVTHTVKSETASRSSKKSSCKENLIKNQTEIDKSTKVSTNKADSVNQKSKVDQREVLCKKDAVENKSTEKMSHENSATDSVQDVTTSSIADVHQHSQDIVKSDTDVALLSKHKYNFIKSLNSPTKYQHSPEGNLTKAQDQPNTSKKRKKSLEKNTESNKKRRTEPLSPSLITPAANKVRNNKHSEIKASQDKHKNVSRKSKEKATEHRHSLETKHELKIKDELDKDKLHRSSKKSQHITREVILDHDKLESEIVLTEKKQDKKTKNISPRRENVNLKTQSSDRVNKKHLNFTSHEHVNSKNVSLGKDLSSKNSHTNSREGNEKCHPKEKATISSDFKVHNLSAKGKGPLVYVGTFNMPHLQQVFQTQEKSQVPPSQGDTKVQHSVDKCKVNLSQDKPKVHSAQDQPKVLTKILHSEKKQIEPLVHQQDQLKILQVHQSRDKPQVLDSKHHRKPQHSQSEPKTKILEEKCNNLSEKIQSKVSQAKKATNPTKNIKENKIAVSASSSILKTESCTVGTNPRVVDMANSSLPLYSQTNPQDLLTSCITISSPVKKHLPPKKRLSMETFQSNKDLEDDSHSACQTLDLSKSIASNAQASNDQQQLTDLLTSELPHRLTATQSGLSTDVTNLKSISQLKIDKVLKKLHKKRKLNVVKNPA
ncbi:protein NPAT [Biomphalaria pfeifferi]|uniref:Protein NPAT n=1 Tax=Biomphalaria pfeifferi TaxID=112525 RepID=A0AAD8F6H3_BIOPF|nr:protein NPAT [Biomphalaria pfeifferi]